MVETKKTTNSRTDKEQRSQHRKYYKASKGCKRREHSQCNRNIQQQQNHFYHQACIGSWRKPKLELTNEKHNIEQKTTPIVSNSKWNMKSTKTNGNTEIGLVKATPGEGEHMLWKNGQHGPCRKPWLCWKRVTVVSLVVFSDVLEVLTGNHKVSNGSLGYQTMHIVVLELLTGKYRASNCALGYQNKAHFCIKGIDREAQGFQWWVSIPKQWTLLS